MRSKQIKVIHIPNDTKPTKVIDAKPYPLFILALLTGIAFIIFRQYILGILILLFVLGFFLLLPKRKLIEFYDDFMIIYNLHSLNECKIIYYDEVVYYTYRWGVNADEVEIGLIDSSIERIEGFSKFLFESYLRVFLKDKRKKIK